jgi:4-amino-4-deoxy-L-arabinose transferase-like glycosyltransferase
MIFFILSTITVFIIFQLKRKISDSTFTRIKTLIFWVMWLILGISPVIFLLNRVYRYYLTYSLPPLIVLFLVGSRAVARYVRCKELHFAIIIIIYVVTTTISSAYYFGKCDKEGLNHENNGGYFNFIKKGYTVKAVWDGLVKTYPILPTNALLIFEDIDCWSFWFMLGPRLWYRDNTIMAFDKESLNLKFDQGNIYIDDPRHIKTLIYEKVVRLPERVYLDPERTFIFGLQEGKIREHEFSSLYETGKD